MSLSNIRVLQMITYIILQRKNKSRGQYVLRQSYRTLWKNIKNLLTKIVFIGCKVLSIKETWLWICTIYLLTVSWMDSMGFNIIITLNKIFKMKSLRFIRSTLFIFSFHNKATKFYIDHQPSVIIFFFFFSFFWI